MILLLKNNITMLEANALVDRLQWMNFRGVILEEKDRLYISVVSGINATTDTEKFSVLPEVEKVLPLTEKFKLVSRAIKKDKTSIQLKNSVIGDGSLVVMAGPCSIESEAQIHAIAKVVAASGAKILRGGAFKPRTSPYDFQGLGEEGLRYMQGAANQYNLACISEVMDAEDIELVADYVDIVQIGARNMQNFSLLKKLGKVKNPILLKRGMSATYSDLLMAAEYILQAGNANVILCERGVRTFETYTRNMLDVAAVPVLNSLTHLPVIVDPSHGTGIRQMVPPMAYAAVAAGADGVIVEVHTHPSQSISDADQTISPEVFDRMMRKLDLIHDVVVKDS